MSLEGKQSVGLTGPQLLVAGGRQQVGAEADGQSNNCAHSQITLAASELSSSDEIAKFR